MTNTDVAFKSAVPVVPVEDFPAAVAFYRDTLGFTATFEQGAYGGVERDGLELHLDAADPTTRKGSGAVTVRINVAGIDSFYAEVEPSGAVDPNEPLETKPWGTRQFSVRDTAGNRITFVESA